MTKNFNQPLKDINVLDLTRVLAGPTCTQILGDLGANIIKIERPITGDDSRNLGPPYLDKNSKDQKESAYFLSVNRNKNSVTIDLTTKEGQELARSLVKKCDVVVENFRAGNLKQYGLDYKSLKKIKPDLIYCSITGFGQNGPYSKRGGYDYLVQAMGGIMSITGEKNGPPTKIGVGVSDIITGLYSCISILAALRFREKTSKGQSIDISLMDAQVSWLSYVAQSYLISKKIPMRIGNDHPSIVPYQTVEAKDGLMVLAIANNNQFKNFCNFAGLEKISKNEKYRTNSLRVLNRKSLNAIIKKTIKKKEISYWVKGLINVNVPCGPINNIKQVFKDPQVIFRKMAVDIKHKNKKIKIVGSPIKLNKSPVTYKKSPPTLGEDTVSVLKKFLKLNKSRYRKRNKKNVWPTIYLKS
ncbi:CoA transferase [Alphaproteobacteria bacterium]|nr:CoA transferase [Alphaproteobacteria bacterium]